MESDLMKTLVSLGLGVVLAAGLLFYFFGDRSWIQFGGKETGPPPLCEKDLACAQRKAADLAKAARGGPLEPFAVALGAAFSRKDCAFAADLVVGADNVTVTDAPLIEKRRTLADAERNACGREPPAPTTPPPVGSEIVLERTRVGDAGAAYMLTVHADGRIEFDGKAGTATHGAAAGAIDASRARELFDLLDHVHFERLDKEYLSTATDRSLARVTRALGSERRSVVADAPCQNDAAIAAGLCFVTSRIDELANSSRFIAGD